MSDPKCPEGFVKKAVLLAAFERAGASISDDQLERWRGSGLLPSVRHAGLGQARGSITYYPEITINQAIEASRLFGIKRSKEFVGFELWWLGFEVDQQYWRPVIEARSGVMTRGIRKIARLIYRAENNEKIADLVYGKIPKSIAPKPIKGITHNISQEDFSDAVHTLLNAVGGVQYSIDNIDAYSENEKRPRAIQNLLGLSQARTDQILETRIQTRDAFQSILKGVSSVKNIPSVDASFFEGEKFLRFLRARNDVRNGLEAASNLHESTRWIYGDRTFGLKIARWFFESAPKETKAEIALLWMEVRNSQSAEFLKSNEIDEMLIESRHTLQLSRKFKRMIETNTQMAAICTRKKLRKAFSNKDSFEALCAELKKLT